MLNRDEFMAQLAELPLYVYDFIDPKGLEFTDRVQNLGLSSRRGIRERV